MAKLPDNLTENSEPHDGILLRKVQATHQAANAPVGVGHAPAIEESAFAQGLTKQFGDAFDFRSGGQ